MSEQKVLEALEGNPTGLSINDIAEKSGLHRNTITGIVKKLQEEKKIQVKKVGLSKLYYLKRYSGLHQIESGYKGKNISVGIGVSDLEDGYKAAVSAAKQAAMQASHGSLPTFSLVFVSSRYNPQIDKVVKGINSILGTNWIGCTTDREINSLSGFSKGTVEVLCLETKYLHFGVDLVEDYRRNPFENGKKAIQMAIKQCPVERSGFATAQFMRGTKKGFAEIVRNPPYFILSFIGGASCKNNQIVPGMEVEFIEGIKHIVGSYVPILGGSATSDFDDMMKYKAENYVFANGSAYKNGAVTCFVVSELIFSYGLSHGYTTTTHYGIITKVTGNGRVVEEINGKPATEEYCRLAGLKKNLFMKNPFYHCVLNPICSIDVQGNVYPKVIPPLSPSPKETRIAGSEKFTNGTAILIGNYDEGKTICALGDAIDQAIQGYEEMVPVVALTFCCSVQRFLLGDKAERFFDKFQERYRHLNLIGFFTAGEIGNRKNATCSYNNITSISFVLFDKLQVE